jgi:hypothetical protein
MTQISDTAIAAAHAAGGNIPAAASGIAAAL